MVALKRPVLLILGRTWSIPSTWWLNPIPRRESASSRMRRSRVRQSMVLYLVRQSWTRPGVPMSMSLPSERNLRNGLG